MWIEPKTDWVITDSFNFEDYNRIKNNIAYLYEMALNFYSSIQLEDMGSDKIGYNEFPYAEEFNRLELWLFGGEVDEQSVLHIGVCDYGGEENMMEMNIPINYCPRCGKKL